MKISEVISRIVNYYPPLEQEATVDTVKWGDTEKECTGVAVTCCATADVIRKSVALGANLIIVHEPLFYNHSDELAPLDGAAAFTAKKQLLNETGVVIWRNHDRIHGGSPDRYKRPYMDGIFYGVMKELGWENHAVRFHNKPLIFRIPETTGLRLAQELMEKMNLNGIRVEGDPDCKVRKVFFCEHVRGWNVDFETIHLIESEDIDAIIPLETVDWTVSLYVRDSVQLGRPRVMLEAGHFNFEELGMKHMLTWLPKLLGGTVPVHYVQSGDGFMYLKRADSQKI